MVNKPGIVDILEAGLKANAVRQKVVANNMANFATPGFRRSEVNFEDALRDALDSKLDTTTKDLSRIEAEIITPMRTPVDSKGNDVDLDTEVGALMKTASRQKTMLRMLKKQYEMLDAAMKI